MSKINKIVKDMKNKIYDKSTEEEKNKDDDFDINTSEFIRKGIKTGFIACLSGVLIGGAINAGTGIGVNLQEYTDKKLEKSLETEEINFEKYNSLNQYNIMEIKDLDNKEYETHTLCSDVLYYLEQENLVK